MFPKAFFVVLFISTARGLSIHKQIQSIVPFVVNGTDAKIEEFPFMVSLQWKFNETAWIHYCGGTILNENWVLTAGKQCARNFC